MEEITKTLAQTAVQDSHIICHPSRSRDIAPATSADKDPVHIVRDALPSIQFSSSRTDLQQIAAHQTPRPRPHHHHRHHDEDEERDHLSDSGSEISVKNSSTPPKLRARRPNLPSIPDLRFEQSYLKQLETANGSVMWMVIITIREQILFPGVQGFFWALGLAGLRSLRAQQAENGRSLGSWIREYFGRIGKTDTTMMGNQAR